MSDTRKFLEFERDAWRKLGLARAAFIDFLLEHGRDYPTGPQTYAGRRDPAKRCFMNATLLALGDDSLTYVEGRVSVCGLAIEHAWCVDADGIVIDTTLAPSPTDGTRDRITGYFGIPFQTDYLRKASLLNGVYGLLGFEARKTLHKLVELGLEDGQRWLLERRARSRAT